MREQAHATITTEPTRVIAPAQPLALATGGMTVVDGATGPVVLRALRDGSVRVEHAGPAGEVLLRVAEAIELCDGDLVAAGRQWMAFEASRDGRPGRLCLLDGEGGVRMGITLRGSALSLGREVGDVVLPGDESLAELHLQILVRREGTFLQDLSSEGGTWVVVRSGEALPGGSTLAIGEGLVRVSTHAHVEALRAEHEETVADHAWQTAVYAAA